MVFKPRKSLAKPAFMNLIYCQKFSNYQGQMNSYQKNDEIYGDSVVICEARLISGVVCDRLKTLIIRR